MNRLSFRRAPRRPAALDAVPMINVAFLLLIFFLLAARIAPPDPLAVTLPEADAATESTPGDALYVAADGALAFRGATGEAVYAALASAAGDAPLAMRVDRNLDGADLADILARVAEAGVSEVTLIVSPAP